MEYQKKSGTASAAMKIPEALYALAKNINELGGHKTEGIFRIPGDMQAVNKFRCQMDQGCFACQISSCHDAATLLKLFFRELKEPIVPDEYYETALRLGQEKNMEGLKALIRNFPEANQDTLWWIISYLQTFLVDKTREHTKMDKKI